MLQISMLKIHLHLDNEFEDLFVIQYNIAYGSYSCRKIHFKLCERTPEFGVNYQNSLNDLQYKESLIVSLIKYIVLSVTGD